MGIGSFADGFLPIRVDAAFGAGRQHSSRHSVLAVYDSRHDLAVRAIRLDSEKRVRPIDLAEAPKAIMAESSRASENEENLQARVFIYDSDHPLRFFL